MIDDPLESLMAEVSEEKAPKPPGQAIAKLRYSHSAMIDLLLAHPDISQNEVADAFGYTASWVCQIMSSDAFKAAYAARAEEMLDPALRATIKERFEALVLRSAEILAEKLNKPSDQVPDNLALRTFELGSRAAGYGARDIIPPVPPAQIHLHLESLAGGLTQLLQRKKREVIEGEAREVAVG